MKRSDVLFIVRNDRLQAIILAANGNPKFEQCKINTRTELDSHANMCVYGDDCFVFEFSGKTCLVNSFSSSLGQATDVQICVLAVACDLISTDGP